jgi:hypothetical protein
MRPREEWRHSIRVFLATAPSPLRLSSIIRGALDAKGSELSRQDFSAFNQLLRVNGWKRRQSGRAAGETWYRQERRPQLETSNLRRPSEPLGSRHLKQRQP